MPPSASTARAGSGSTSIPCSPGTRSCPEAEKSPERVDLIALTHGHGDHVGDTVELWKKFRPPVVALVELRQLAGRRRVSRRKARQHGPNKGGTVDIDGVKLTLTDANHSSSADDGQYLGEPAGIVLELEDGFTIYFAGDTNVFSSMQLIGRIYEPDVAVLPIGGHYTMAPREAAVALELLGVEALRSLPLRHVPDPHRNARGAARPGTRRRDPRARARRDDRAVRERWLGATGTRVPEIAVEGELDLPADVLWAERRNRRRDQGRP